MSITNIYITYSIPWLSMEPDDVYEDVGAVEIIGVFSDLEHADHAAQKYVDDRMSQDEDLKRRTIDEETADKNEFPRIYYLSYNKMENLSDMNGCAVVVKHLK